MPIKLDLNKAYDRVSYDLFIEVMRKIGLYDLIGVSVLEVTFPWSFPLSLLMGYPLFFS